MQFYSPAYDPSIFNPDFLNRKSCGEQLTGFPMSSLEINIAMEVD